MAVNVERDPMVFAIEDDPMRAPARYHDTARPVPAVADPAPLGLAALAVTTLVLAIFAALLFVASVRTTAAVSLMLALLTVTLLLLGIGDAGAHAGLIKIAGWFGIATAAVGLYAAFAALINSTYERTLLPLRAVRHVR